ncbi:MAG: hypothetical protein MUC43_12695, partial [Pirellula sp.]|nr:hypothetical protein [Pirellula sp.]
MDAGQLNVTDGLIVADGRGVFSSGGDVLLWGQNGLNVQSGVTSTVGDITFRSDGTVDIQVNGTLQAGDTGYINSRSLTHNGIIAATNGLLLQTIDTLNLNTAVTSTNGSIGLISTAGSVNQNVSVNSAADFYVGAAQNFTMGLGTTVTSTGNTVINTGIDTNLLHITAANIAINARGGILDSGPNVNPSLIANSAILNAGSRIGTVVNPIETRIGTLTSRSGSGGIVIQEIAAGGDLIVGPVAAISANIASIKEVKFNSTNPGVTLTGQTTNAVAQQNVESLGAANLGVAAGVLNINSNIVANGVSFTGVGVTSSGGSIVNAGSGTVLVDGTDAAINLAGLITTNNATSNAVIIQDATTALLGNITTGAGGTTTLGGAGADNISGAVTQTGIINTGSLVGNTGSSVTLGGANRIA